MNTIGVITFDFWHFLDDEKHLITDLIYFDKLFYEIPIENQMEKMCVKFPNGTERYKSKIQEIELLEKAGLISRLDNSKIKGLSSYKSKEYFDYAFKSIELSGQMVEKLKYSKSKNNISSKDFAEFLQTLRNCTDLDARANSVLLNTAYNDFHFPIIKSSEPNRALSAQNNPSHYALKTVLKKFPSVFSHNQIDKLIEFKSDPDTILKLNRLRNWVLEIGKSNYSEKEIHQKVEYLLNEYSSQLELHKLKYDLGAVEIFLITSLEVVENIATFKFSKAAKAVFDINRKDLLLLEEEKKFTGNELALIHHIHNKNSL